MVTALELGVLGVVVALLLGSYRMIQAVRPFIVNTVVGLAALILAVPIGYGVEITPIVLLVVAIGGLPGAVLVVMLAYLGHVFTPVVL